MCCAAFDGSALGNIGLACLQENTVPSETNMHVEGMAWDLVGDLPSVYVPCFTDARAHSRVGTVACVLCTHVWRWFVWHAWGLNLFVLDS